MSPLDTDVAVLANRVQTLEQRTADLDSRFAKAEGRHDELMERLFDKIDGVSTRQQEAMDSLRDDLKPVMAWVNSMQGALKAIITIAGALTTIGAAVWGVLKYIAGRPNGHG